MFASITIDNFKPFAHFEIAGFRRVNVITGRNNAGKTALLEALFIHSGAANVALPFATETFRGIPRLDAAMEAAFGAMFTNFDITRTITLLATDQLELKTTSTLN